MIKIGKADSNTNTNSFAWRLYNLRDKHGLSQMQLAKELHTTSSQISRIESGVTEYPSIEIVIEAARYFHVSTDYLLGITQITSPKSYDISELGLSEEAVTRLITRRIDVDIVNRLLEHENFPKLCIMIRNYFDDTIAEAIMARNKVIDFAVDQLTDLMTAEPSKRKEIIKDKQFLSSQKLGANEADIEKIKIQFMAILRDIKSGMQKREPRKAVATAEAVQMIRNALPDKPASDITSTDLANAVAYYMGQTTDLNDEGLAMVQNLAKYICDNSVPEKNSENKELGNQIKNNNNDSGSDLLVGLNHITVNYADIQKVLENNPTFRNKYLITVPVDEDLSKISWNGRDYSTRRNIYKQCHCLLTSNEKTIKWALASGREDAQIKEFGSIKPCIWGSDAHEYQKMFRPAEDRHCWVKSELTFEGLLQVIYEPSERVCIQNEQPDIGDIHQIIDSVRFENESFQETPIYFNSSLTCIIGGKSTGKSMLLRQMARAIDNDYALQQEGRLPHNTFPSVKTTVTWKDGTSNGRKIVYIPQTFLNSTIDNPEEMTAINKIIFDVLLQEPDIKKAYENLKADTDKLQKKVQLLIDELIIDKTKLTDLNELIKKDGSSSTYNSTIQQLESERKVLAQKVNVTPEEINRFNEVEKNIESIVLKNEKLHYELENQKKIFKVSVVVPGYFSCLDGLSIEHDFSKDFPVTENTLNSALTALNQEILPKWETIINLNCKNLQSSINQNSHNLNLLKEEYESLKEKVAQSEQLGKLTTRINAERKLLQSAIEREKQKEDLLKSINQIKEKIIASQSDYLDIYTTFGKIIRSTGTSRNTSLIFDAEIVWKQTEFMECLARIFNNKNFTPFRTKHNYDLTDLKPEDYGKQFLSTLWNAWEEPEKYGGLSFKAGNTLTDVLSYIFKNWYNIHYIVKSGNDSIESMSPGKKALVLLEMLISLEDSKCPILIDQPEDDLDNRSIYNDLVQYIRRKKKERQIIIVTHNANVVLGADAEEIIIANQDGIGTENAEKRFEYRSGAIENDEILTDDTGTPLKGILNQNGIQTQICDILEGGRPAFKLRQNKYAGIQHD